MHNLGSTQMEMGQEYGYGETSFGESSFGEYGPSGEFYGEGEYMGEGEYISEEYGEVYGESSGPFSEAEEMELAAELLSVSNEAELDQFLGGLFRKAARAVGNIVRSPIGRALAPIVKNVAKSALPMVGGALGSLIPIPGVGTAVGTALGSAAGRMFGLELEGMSAEDQEFEVARRVVRFAGDAAQQAASAPPNVPPQQAAQAAAQNAAQRHAPGLASGAAPAAGAPAAAAAPNLRAPGFGPRRNSGRWIRRGRVIIILGA